MVTFGADVPTDAYLYHYTRAEPLLAILRSRTLWMNPLATMNDPREALQWSPSLTLDDNALDENFDFHELIKSFDEAIRSRIRIASLNVDRPATGLFQYHRGYSRARMWAQYADGHRGACLIFDQPQLISDFRMAFADRAIAAAQRVAYADWPVAENDGLLSINSSDLNTVGVAEIAARLSRRSLGPLFLTKNTDWSSEDEFRLVVESEADHEELSIEGSLAAIVLGDQFDSELVPNVVSIVGDQFGHRVTVARMRWVNGQPIVVPALP